jgi:large subunit ribosomal protein L1
MRPDASTTKGTITMAKAKSKEVVLEAQEAAVATEVTAEAQAETSVAVAEDLKEDSKKAKAGKKAAKTETKTETDTDDDEISEDDDEVTREAKIAKAGKRSAKSIKEAEEKQAKEERKAQAAEDGEKPVGPAPKTRTKLERRGKNYRKTVEGLDLEKEYTLAEALEIAQKANPVKFDATVELHINLGVDPRHADQNIRDNLVLPAGTGKKVRVAVFADAEDQAAAKKAGADIAGNEEFLAQLEKGVIDFDILIATPTMMSKLGKYARTLGPKGLMPNPKSGTVTTDITKAVSEAKAGRVEYRVDSTGIVHLGVGKISFGTEKLTQNVRAVFTSVKAAKPGSIKGSYIKGIFITTTMGPSFKVAVSEV